MPRAAAGPADGLQLRRTRPRAQAQDTVRFAAYDFSENRILAAALADDRSLQPHENVVPLVRTAVLDRWGDRLRQALDMMSARLTSADLITLNRAVEVEGLDEQDAAARWWGGG